MEILSYFAELIKTRKEVGIPGLGTFYKKKSPGRYDVETHSFQPPSYTLNFTSELKEETFLRDFISKKREISSEASTDYIDQFVKEIQRQLSEKQEADFGELGTIYGTLKNLSFIQKNESNLGFDFYGLPHLKEGPVTLNVDQSTDEPQRDQEIAFEQPAVSNQQLDLEDNNADLSDGSEEPEESDSTRLSDQPVSESFEVDERRIPLYLKIIIAFAILMVAVVVAYFIKPDLFKGILNDNSQGNLNIKKNSDESKVDSIAYTDSVRSSNEKAIQTVDSVKDSLAITPQIITADSTTWEVIGASVINQKEASNFIAQMKAIGINAKVVPNMPGKKRLKISIATFKDEESAKEGRKLLVTKLKDRGIYIYQNKHTHKPQ